MGKRRDPSDPIPADEVRCTRNDGKRWRCYELRHPGAIYCLKHHLSYLSKCRPGLRNPRQNPRSPKNPSPGEVWAFGAKFPRHYARIQSPDLAAPLVPAVASATTGTFRASRKKPAVKTSSLPLAFQMVGVKTVRWMGIPFYRIFPSRGEVWAVRGDKGEVKLVEVESDFREEEGVTVAGLVPVEAKGEGEEEEKGVRVYERQLHEGFRLVQTYESKKMGAFKFRVSAERVEGGEGDKQLWKVMWD